MLSSTIDVPELLPLKTPNNSVNFATPMPPMCSLMCSIFVKTENSRNIFASELKFAWKNLDSVARVLHFWNTPDTGSKNFCIGI